MPSVVICCGVALSPSPRTSTTSLLILVSRGGREGEWGREGEGRGERERGEGRGERGERGEGRGERGEGGAYGIVTNSKKVSIQCRLESSVKGARR